jgi:tripartite-type tricarboxylate transporter receptor subunit TctC
MKDLGLERGVRRRSALVSLTGAAGWLALPAFAKGYPERPIKLVVPFAGGGTTDVAARLLAEVVQQRSGATLIIDNKAGAGAAIGIEYASRAAPDGYTLLYGSDALILGPLTRSNLSFSLDDFVPLARVRSSSVFLAVTPGLPVSEVKELVALAKAKPGQLRYGTGGIATVLHIAAAQFMLRSGIDMVHVPYKGTAPAVNDLLGGHVDMVWAGSLDLAAHRAVGALRVIANTGERRSEAMPQVPTMSESGYPNLVVVNWNGVLAPRGTPPEVVAWLTNAIASATESPEFLRRGAPIEIEPGALLKGHDFASFLHGTNDRYRQVIKQANIKLTE